MINRKIFCKSGPSFFARLIHFRDCFQFGKSTSGPKSYNGDVKGTSTVRFLRAKSQIDSYSSHEFE